VARAGAVAERRLARVAAGSCADQDQPQPVWDAIRADAPDLYLPLGDNMYGDSDDPAVLREKYWRLEAIAGFAAMRRTVPLYGTWDDHDYGRNDSGAEYPAKDASLQLFLDFLREPADSPRRGRRGAYDAMTFGPPGARVQVVALDLRYHRSALALASPRGPYRPDASPDATMLGAEQWAWLERELARPAEARLILSSVQLLLGSEFGERWLNMPLERERLLRAVGGAPPSTTVVLSGDRHFGEIAALDPGPAGPPLYEMTTSGLTRSETPDATNALRTDGPVSANHYGLVDFEWDAPEPALVLRLRDVAGRDLIAERRVPLAPPPPLAPGPSAPP
jgi:alkaline phosphatase D